MFLRHAREFLAADPLLEPIRKARTTFEGHLDRILRRWHSLYTDARLEGVNGLFQAARARAKGYRNVTTFITMIYLIEALLGDLVRS
jgi:transposase